MFLKLKWDKCCYNLLKIIKIKVLFLWNFFLCKSTILWWGICEICIIHRIDNKMSKMKVATISCDVQIWLVSTFQKWEKVDDKMLEKYGPVSV
jgi:hypothetical protein